MVGGQVAGSGGLGSTGFRGGRAEHLEGGCGGTGIRDGYGGGHGRDECGAADGTVEAKSTGLDKQTSLAFVMFEALHEMRENRFGPGGVFGANGNAMGVVRYRHQAGGDP